MTREELKSMITKKYGCGKQLATVQRRIVNNTELGEWYERLAEKYPDRNFRSLEQLGGQDYIPAVTHLNTARNVCSCSRWWQVSFYQKSRIKLLERTNLCHNRFCDNCQNVIAVQRAQKFGPMLDVMADNFDVYHITLTAPNCTRDGLPFAVSRNFKGFKRFVRFFTGDAKIKGIDFSNYGFVGAVRALEITKNENDGTFHPHLHVIALMRKGLDLDGRGKRKHINKFSFDNEHGVKSHKKKAAGRPNVTKWTDFEIFLQKLWRLIYDGEKVTLENILALKEGYSCTCRDAAGDYKEVFKYATKGIFRKSKEEKENLEQQSIFANERYLDFEALYFALKGRKIVQGYGCLNKCKFDIEINQDMDYDEIYFDMLEKLSKLETPEQIFESFDEIVEQAKQKRITYISKNSIIEAARAENDVEWELENGR